MNWNRTPEGKRKYFVMYFDAITLFHQKYNNIKRVVIF